MRTEGIDIDFRFIEDIQDVEGIRRIVIRVSEGNIIVTGSEDSQLRYFIELQGVSEEIDTWSCRFRRAESIAIIEVIANDYVRIGKCNIFIPSHISDVEVHSSRGSMEIREIPANVLAISDRGDISISNAKFVEVSSVNGNIIVDRSEGCSARSINGTIRCSRIAGSVQVESQNSIVLMDQVEKNVAAVCDQGKIIARRVKGRVRLISNKGDIELEVSGAFGGGEVQTYSGDISIQLEYSSIEFRAETLSGRIEANFPTSASGIGPQRCTFRTGEGSRRLYVKSILGDIEIS